MGRKYSDNAKTTLGGGISAVATTLTVAAGKGDLFPQVTGAGAAGSAPNSFVIKLKNAAGTIEKIRVEHRAAASDVLGSAGFPLVRGFDGTIAQAWNAGDFVSLTIERVAAQGWEDGFNANALGRAFGYKDSTTVGLNFGYYGGLVSSGGALTTTADGTVALTASQTNFIERTTAGVVSANIAGFTAGRVPLYTVVTSATAITAITEKRSTLMQDKDGGLTAPTLTATTGVVTPTVDTGSVGSGALKTNNGTTILTWANDLSTTLAGVLRGPASMLSPITNSLGADVGLNNTANYFDGPSVAQGIAGTWFVSGTVTLKDTVGNSTFRVKLWDGTAVISSTVVFSSNGGEVTVSLSGFLTSPLGNIRMSVRNTSGTTGVMLFNQSGNGKDSTITAVRIA